MNRSASQIVVMAFELWNPVIFGFAAAITYLNIPLANRYVFPDTLPELLSAIITVAGVAIGFLATVKSILISIDDRPIVQRMKEANLYSRFIKYLRAAIAWSFLLTLLSCAALLFDYSSLKEWDAVHARATAAWIFVAVASVLSYHRISRIWAKVLEKIDTQHPR